MAHRKLPPNTHTPIQLPPLFSHPPPLYFPSFPPFIAGAHRNRLWASALRLLIHLPCTLTHTHTSLHYLSKKKNLYPSECVSLCLHIFPSIIPTTSLNHLPVIPKTALQKGEKGVCQSQRLHVVPLKQMRGVCDVHRRYASTMRLKKSRKIQLKE